MTKEPESPVVSESSSESGRGEEFFYDPYKLSNQGGGSTSDDEVKPRRKFNSLLFVVISVVVCVLLGKSCDWHLTRPSELVLGSSPGAHVDEGGLIKIANERIKRIKHDDDLFYECLNDILDEKDPDTQVERFLETRYRVLQEVDSKYVGLLELFGSARKEYDKLFSDYDVVWTNSGGLAIHCEDWNREHDARQWKDLVDDAVAAQRALVNGLSAFEEKYQAKIGQVIGTQERSRKWLKNMQDLFATRLGRESPSVKQYLDIRANEIKSLMSLVELYQANADKVKEKDGKLTFEDPVLQEKAKTFWELLDKDETSMSDLFGDSEESSDQSA